MRSRWWWWWGEVERRREEGEEEEVEVVVVLGRCGRFFLVLRPCLAASAAARSARAEDEREVGGLLACLHTHARRLLGLVSSRAGFFWFWEAFLRVSPAFFFLFCFFRGARAVSQWFRVFVAVCHPAGERGSGRRRVGCLWLFGGFLSSSSLLRPPRGGLHLCFAFGCAWILRMLSSRH